MHESSLLSVLMYGSETRIWKEKERSRIRTVQMYSLRYLLGIRRLYKVPIARIRELCVVWRKVLKVFSSGLAIWREWGRIELLKGCWWGSVQAVAQSLPAEGVGLFRKSLLKKRFASKENSV